MQRIKLNNSKKELSIEEAFEKYQRNNVLKKTIKANKISSVNIYLKYLRVFL